MSKCPVGTLKDRLCVNNPHFWQHMGHNIWTETADSSKHEMCHKSGNVFRNCNLLGRWRSVLQKTLLRNKEKQTLNSWHMQASYIIKLLWQLPCSETWLEAQHTILTSQTVPLFTRYILYTTLYCTVKTWAKILNCTNNTSHLVNLDVIAMYTVVFQKRGWEVEVQRRHG